MQKMILGCGAMMLIANAGAADLTTKFKLDPAKAPAQNFNLTSWKINLPQPDLTGKGSVLEIVENDLNNIEKPLPQNNQWFYTNPETGAMVFKAPNTAPTTKNSSNARSELRGMLRKGNMIYDDKHPRNNWVLHTHPNAMEYGAVGGRLSATLAVDWVSTSGDDTKFPAFSTVVGQIHGSGKMEPLKIYYRKMPNHEHGSLFWNYEISPEDPNMRLDVSTNVWGDFTLTKKSKDPENGLKLGEIFSYDVDVKGDIMTLTFTRGEGQDQQTIVHTMDLVKGHPDYDIDQGFGNDWMYFKAGAYNQCNQGTEHPVWGTGCSNNGVEAGDYTQVSFYKLDTSYGNY